jgi:hypothetical protein
MAPALLAFQDEIFAQDLPILESQWPKQVHEQHIATRFEPNRKATALADLDVPIYRR